MDSQRHQPLPPVVIMHSWVSGKAWVVFSMFVPIPNQSRIVAVVLDLLAKHRPVELGWEVLEHSSNEFVGQEHMVLHEDLKQGGGMLNNTAKQHGKGFAGV